MQIQEHQQQAEEEEEKEKERNSSSILITANFLETFFIILFIPSAYSPLSFNPPLHLSPPRPYSHSLHHSVRLPVITEHLHNRHNSLRPAGRAPFPQR